MVFFYNDDCLLLETQVSQPYGARIRVFDLEILGSLLSR